MTRISSMTGGFSGLSSISSLSKYKISANVSAVNEGGTLLFTVSTTGVADGSTVYWALGDATVGSTVSASDFTDGLGTGILTISNSSASFSRSILVDTLTEGDEILVMQLQVLSSSGFSKVAQATPVTVYDTSFAATAVANVQYIIIAGGGGGGADITTNAYGGGGGGAGGYVTGYMNTVGNTQYTVVIGAGGAGFNTGTGSSFRDVASTGGGSGAGWLTAGSTGGSGGGGSSSQAAGLGTAGQGFAGGAGSATYLSAGGGGGAGATGVTAIDVNGGDGGVGIANTWTNSGELVNGTYYLAGGGGGANTYTGTRGAGGAGGGGYSATSAGDATGTVRISLGLTGTVNTGGGGGGSAGTNSSGLAGGSGIVILRWRIGYNNPQNTTGSPGAYTDTTGGFVYYTFRQSGTITF